MPFPPALAIENALAYAPLFIKGRILVASPAAAAPFKLAIKASVFPKLPSPHSNVT